MRCNERKETLCGYVRSFHKAKLPSITFISSSLRLIDYLTFISILYHKRWHQLFPNDCSSWCAEAMITIGFSPVCCSSLNDSASIYVSHCEQISCRELDFEMFRDSCSLSIMMLCVGVERILSMPRILGFFRPQNASATTYLRCPASPT